MEQQDETFQVTVQINEGMEPTTLTVIAQENTSLSPAHDLVLKITRDKDNEQLAVIIRDADHCWQLLEGNMEQHEVDLIGAAIEGHYA
jgi:formyltetrahydrofolate hydrolase